MVTVIHVVATLCEHRARYEVLLYAIAQYLDLPPRIDSRPISVDLPSGVRPSEFQICPSNGGRSGTVFWRYENGAIAISYVWAQDRALCSEVWASGETYEFLSASFGRTAALKIHAFDECAKFLLESWPAPVLSP